VANANNQYDARRNTVFSGALFLATAMIFGIWIVWDATFYRLVTYSPWADYWEHTATLTEWLRNFASPGNPHAADPSLSPRYMPFFWVLTYIGLLFKLDAIDLMAISAVFNYVLIVVGLRLFLQNYFRNPWAPLIGFIAIFMLWGISWNWSNLYQLRSFFYVASYPSSFVFGLSLISFWVVLKLLRGEAPLLITSVLIAALSSLMFVCHPLTGVFGITGCGILVLTEDKKSIRHTLSILLALAAGLFLAELWPYFSVWKLTLGLYGEGPEKWFATGEAIGPLERFRSGIWQHIFYNPRLVLVILGPALLGIPICIWLLLQKKYLFIASGALVMSIPYFAHFFIEVPLAHRFLLFVTFYLQLALVWLILRIFENWQISPRQPLEKYSMWATLACLTSIFILNIGMLTVEFFGYTYSPKTLQLQKKNTQLPEGMTVVDLYTKLTDPLPETAVVLASSSTGWPLPTVKAKVVSLYHENPMLLDQAERYEATGAFFFSSIEHQKRIDIVKDYNVTHILTFAKEKGVPQTTYDWINQYAVVVAEIDDYRMYELAGLAAETASISAITEVNPASNTSVAEPQIIIPDEAGDSGASQQ
jgi:hypothetical protein